VYAGLRESEPLLVEVQNALGIAYMRQGQLAKDAASRDQLWRVAEDFYKRALRVNPNVVRVLQNQGSLRLLQGDAYSTTDDVAGRRWYEQARQLYLRTLEINPHDQFPHYRMAVVCAKLADWNCARQYLESGPQEPGSVRPELWERLKQAIDTENAALLAD
jgi:tetratricopeptide (TPR) repeat protein